MKEALYYKANWEKTVNCYLCPNFCFIKPGEWGDCRSRQNIDGKLFAVGYGESTGISIDPMEKKPLYHFYPGSEILSLGPNSCNLHCDFCQNFEISQHDCPTQQISPEQLIDIAERRKVPRIAFTYTEPFTWLEYLLDCGALMQPKGMQMVLVTNGYVNPQPLEQLLPYISAMNIDLKAASDDFYHEVCQGSVSPVKETIRLSAARTHVEVTNLIIPTLNDSDEEIEELCSFIESINPELPLHFSRYFPRYKSQRPVTPEETLLRAYNIATQRLKHVYLGNISSGDYSNTYCAQCGVLLIERDHFASPRLHMEHGKCPHCQHSLYGRFE